MGLMIATPIATTCPPTRQPVFIRVVGVLMADVTRLHDACGVDADPKDLCARVFNATHNKFLASSSDWLIAKPFKILVVIVVALFIRWLAVRAINRVVKGIASERLAEISPLASERRLQRSQTIASVLRSALGTILLAIVVVTALGELNIDLAPIIASAGIAGVALGFGAQNLVRDYLSGLFFIVEDAYGVGDVVDLGPAKGVVEAVGLRSTRVRDDKGVLWHVRNGEIARVGNTSQGDSRGTIDLIIKHGGDLHAAMTAMGNAADAIWAERGPDLGLLSAPTVLGVQEVDQVGTTLRTTYRRQTGADDADRALRITLMDALAEVGVDLADK